MVTKLCKFTLRAISPIGYSNIINTTINLPIRSIITVRKAVLSGISFRTYISDGWNKLDCVGLGLFIIGFILRLIVLMRMENEHMLEPSHERYYILTDRFLDVSRICLAISLFTFYIRLMYTFSFSIALGPKLIMIGKMVSAPLSSLLLAIVDQGVTDDRPLSSHTPTHIGSSLLHNWLVERLGTVD